MPDETSDLLDQLIAECIRAEESGEPIDRDAMLAEYPQFAVDLEEFFADRDHMKSLARPLATGLPRRQPVPAKIRYFGDYELLEEIARGGMGIVYKARQTSLNRIVAVKMILSGHVANEEDVKRFRTEAQAAANLQHPRVVAVHEVGMHEGQRRSQI